MAMISGVVGLFRGRPVHPVGPDGRMALSDHLRELRGRVMKVALVLLVAFIVGLFFFTQLFDFVSGPYVDAIDKLPADQEALITTNGAGGGLMLHLKLAGFAAVLGTAPFWLYQIWAFVMPGLHEHERKWSYIFLAAAVPLFFAGVVLGYLTLPKGLEVLIAFNPPGVTNVVEFGGYLQFYTRTLLVFGLAFEIPVFVILLNRAGIVSGKTLSRYRPWVIIGIFLFAAAATPSTDPFTMCFMAFPMWFLFEISVVIARINDRRRDRRRPNAGLSVDEPSTL